ncbi:unnamed protein product [Cylicostephanus goldi]|uniref:Uncharacterized protein n=1 Tax=Cylicostephanus goldi TaxID=71465 RepID=A0A3P6QJQ0_CYLGO|nr:unnamed protein product [Cylicostephanus goldi]
MYHNRSYCYLTTCQLGFQLQKQIGPKRARRGYRIPKQGTIQATLFNPQETVVKVFVVAYDMTDMPPSSQTFIRQRIFLGSGDEEGKTDKHLINLIHFRQV